jgi:hypothetical protein
MGLPRVDSASPRKAVLRKNSGVYIMEQSRKPPWWHEMEVARQGCSCGSWPSEPYALLGGYLLMSLLLGSFSSWALNFKTFEKMVIFLKLKKASVWTTWAVLSKRRVCGPGLIQCVPSLKGRPLFPGSKSDARHSCRTGLWTQVLRYQRAVEMSDLIKGLLFPLKLWAFLLEESINRINIEEKNF